MAIGIGQAAGKIRKFFFADEMARDAGREVNGVYYHNLDQVPIELINKKEASKKWIFVESDDGVMVASSNQKIYGSDVQIARDEILRRRRNRPIIIISGTHGAADGGNWARNPSNRIVSRHTRLLDPTFVGDDIRRYQHINGDIFVNDQALFHDIDMGHLLSHSGYDVILASCYSRNDSALRYYLQLEPVTSFVRGNRYAKLLKQRYRPIFFP